jgi:adenosylmethionine-8-amino-7-oxononanoate aminotransferase
MKHRLAALDQKYIWHPFTQMKDWLKSKPTVIVAGEGPFLFDSNGKRYLDGNASIWTNLHGHRHPSINRAITRQLNRIAHSSALGLANEPASVLAKNLINLAPRSLKKVFFSDDGSTALEAALKMSFQYWKHKKAKPGTRNRFLSLQSSYHGDTVGAMSLGGIDTFHETYSDLLFSSEKVMSPYCYRCPFNRAKTERADARTYRKCKWECVGQLENVLFKKNKTDRFAAAVIEPLIQGAAGMVAHPEGYLKKFAHSCEKANVPLILDEVMTGFGRTGTLFACEQEKVKPDFLCLAKGLTGGYLPMAATLTSQRIFDAFLGDYSEKKTFFHGHSYTANQLGAAAALANLGIFEKEQTLKIIQKRSDEIQALLQSSLWKLAHVGDIRQVGMIVGIELVQDWKTKKSYPWEDRVGVRVCEEAKKLGLMTRPVGNVIVLMPPFCISSNQIEKMIYILSKSIRNVCGT